MVYSTLNIFTGVVFWYSRCKVYHTLTHIISTVCIYILAVKLKQRTTGISFLFQTRMTDSLKHVITDTSINIAALILLLLDVNRLVPSSLF